MENVLALQALRQDATDTAFAGNASQLSVGCCDTGTVIIDLLQRLIGTIGG